MFLEELPCPKEVQGSRLCSQFIQSGIELRVVQRLRKVNVASLNESGLEQCNRFDHEIKNGFG